MRIRGKQISVRRLCSVALGWAHCALIFAPIFALICNLTEDVLTRETVISLHLRGLLILVPVALSWFAARFLKNVFLYILASAGIIGVTYLLFGLSPVLIVSGFLCFQRIYNRIVGERFPLLDRAAFPLLAAFAVPFLASFFVERINGVYQMLALLFAGIYLLVCIAQHGIERIDNYITVNANMQNMPTRRIVRISSALLCAALLAAGGLLLPALAGNTTELHYTPPPVTESGPVATPEPEVPMGGFGDEGGQMMPEVEANPVMTVIWHILEYVLLAVSLVGGVLGIFYAVTRLSRSFRRSFNDRGDFVENLQDDKIEAMHERRRKRERPGLLDFSPNAVVRRKYRKTVLRAAKEPPKKWMSPAEAEAHVGLTEEKIGALHQVYEKARYSPTGCDRADTKL